MEAVMLISMIPAVLMVVVYAVHACVQFLSYGIAYVLCTEKKRIWLQSTEGSVCMYTDGTNDYQISTGRTNRQRCIDVKVHGSLLYCPNDIWIMIIFLAQFILFSHICARMLYHMLVIYLTISEASL